MPTFIIAMIFTDEIVTFTGAVVC